MFEHRGPKVGRQQAGAATWRGPAARIRFLVATRLNSNGHRRHSTIWGGSSGFLFCLDLMNDAERCPEVSKIERA
jgi:hypothetical protein